MTRLFINHNSCETLETRCPGEGPYAFHGKLPEYSPTPLVDSTKAAVRLKVGKVLVKDESSRLGLPSFKILGASWAVFRLLAERFDIDFESWRDINQLREKLGDTRGIKLVTATDGNHGRAVARVAKWFGLGSVIFVPKGAVRSRIESIEPEGAQVVVADGHYDKAVEGAACAFESVLAGKVVSVPGPHASVMAGLNCGRVG